MLNTHWTYCKLFSVVLFCFIGITVVAQGDGKKNIYSLMKADDLEAINQSLTNLAKDSSVLNQAYAGALQMKKASLVKNPMNKLKEFKAGREKLEASVSAEPKNGEFKLLRLMIQEKAPAFLGYNKDMEEDGRFLRENFKTLPAAVQKVLADYSKTSSILNPSDF